MAQKVSGFKGFGLRFGALGRVVWEFSVLGLGLFQRFRVVIFAQAKDKVSIKLS